MFALGKRKQMHISKTTKETISMSSELLTPAVTVQDLPDQFPFLEWITEEERIKRLSHDFSWFSPTLKRELADKKAELVARPRNVEEIRQVVAACAKALSIAGSRVKIRRPGAGVKGTAHCSFG